MKPYKTLGMFIAVLLLSFGVNAQSYKLNNEASSLLIDGTSNIHDWTIEAKNTSGNLTAEFDEGKLDEIDKLEFTVIVESLVSGKSGMDKNTYKALNTDKYKEITYKLKKVESIEEVSTKAYKVTTIGSLEIAGTKKDIKLNFNLKSESNHIILTGDYQFNMTEYGIEAPTAMFGTIKTGEKVTVKFETQFNK
ncbi:YceI family protein [Christiangramia forsetii]|uniref:Secreted protein n=2 Tax=Christiangramia forsetii TaxID=411153 RepID=A0M1A6_CHRFK|nr:YceI family protein [Christiangramia forsetii]CAL66401.1 secreted protein [Christiangramia forsetii KT0803]